MYIKTSLYIISSKRIYMKWIVPHYHACKHIVKQTKIIFLLSYKHTNTSTPFFVHTQKSEQHPREPFAEKSSVSTNETEPSKAAASVSESSVAPLRPRNRPAPCAAKGSLYEKLFWIYWMIVLWSCFGRIFLFFCFGSIGACFCPFVPSLILT